MKRIWIYLLLLFGTSSFGQLNLVPNPSFEDTIACPDNLDQVYKTQFWSNFGDSPDYFNSCAPPMPISGVSVPINFTGYIVAAHGNAYCGEQLINYADTTYREFIGATLINPLQIGQTYYVSAYFNLADNPSLAIAINKLCIRFSNNIYSQNSPPPLDNFSQIISDTIIADTSGWFQLKGSLVADSSYTQIIIGNFFENYLTDSLLLYNIGVSSIAYYMIDMICVSTDSNTCFTPISGNYNYNEDKEKLEVFFEGDYIHLYNHSGKNSVIKIVISDMMGTQIFARKSVLYKEEMIPIKNLKTSIYLLTIQEEKINQTIKFIKK